MIDLGIMMGLITALIALAIINNLKRIFKGRS